jgi:hypothetical protein
VQELDDPEDPLDGALAAATPDTIGASKRLVTAVSAPYRSVFLAEIHALQRLAPNPTRDVQRILPIVPS